MKFQYILQSELPQHIVSFLKDGKWYDIKEVKQIRSLNQNNYYWGVCIPIIGDWMGEDNKFVHEVLKSLFLDKQVRKNPLDKRRKIVLQESTTNLDTKEFKEYIDKIRDKFKDLNIPAPNDNSAIDAFNYYNGIR